MKRAITRENVNVIAEQTSYKLPLVATICHYHAEGLRWLLNDMGADLKLALSFTLSLDIHCAETMRVLCAAGMDPDSAVSPRRHNYNTLLQHHIKVFDTCLSSSVNGINYGKGHDVIRALVAYGANTNIVDVSELSLVGENWLRNCITARARCLSATRALLYVGRTLGQRDVMGLVARMAWHTRLLPEWEQE